VGETQGPSTGLSPLGREQDAVLAALIAKYDTAAAYQTLRCMGIGGSPTNR
jgi:hypothetical protein